MIRQTIILISFALCVLGDGHHAVSEQHIKINHKEHHGHHGELAHIGSKKPEHHEEYAWSYPSYEFSYSVHDPHTHDKKGQEESRKGDEVKGEYWLIQPDGRKRTVTYHADKHSGFHAIVHYSDDHHDTHEYHGYHKEDEKKEEEEKKEEGGEAEGGEEKHEKKHEEGSNEESSEESSEEEGGEESRGRERGTVKWGYGPKWERDQDDDGHRYDIGKMIVYGGMGSYGRRDDKKRDDGHRRDIKHGGYEVRDRADDSHQWEERRKFDERRGYPSSITPYYGHASRVNPRFYRHGERKIARRN